MKKKKGGKSVGAILSINKLSDPDSRPAAETPAAAEFAGKNDDWEDVTRSDDFEPGRR